MVERPARLIDQVVTDGGRGKVAAIVVDAARAGLAAVGGPAVALEGVPRDLVIQAKALFSPDVQELDARPGVLPKVAAAHLDAAVGALEIDGALVMGAGVGRSGKAAVHIGQVLHTHHQHDGGAAIGVAPALVVKGRVQDQHILAVEQPQGIGDAAGVGGDVIVEIEMVQDKAAHGVAGRSLAVPGNRGTMRAERHAVSVMGALDAIQHHILQHIGAGFELHGLAGDPDAGREAAAILQTVLAGGAIGREPAHMDAVAIVDIDILKAQSLMAGRGVIGQDADASAADL